MQINAANVARFFTGGQVASTEKWIKKKKEKAGVSTKELQEITDNAVPVTTKNKNVEILCIHEDYEKKPKCLSQSVLLNSLLVVVVPNFRNR